MSASDIFLSYNREDAAVAKLFADAFAREGLEVWWDQTLRSGETYDEVTEAALRGAKAVVVLWSPRSVASHWVRSEATIAHRAKTLVPATIEPCERPVMFELTQTAELAHWRGETGDHSWLAFLSDVRRMVGHDGTVRAPVPLAGAGAGKGQDMANVGLLPIIYRGSDQQLELLTDELTEDITRELARNSYFKVIAPGTMEVWRGKATDHRKVAREIEATYLVEGRVQYAGDAVRLTLQLIEAATGNMMRSLRLARSMAEVAGGSDEFPALVAIELGEQILECEENRAMAKQGAISGRERILRALGFLRRRDSESLNAAIAELRQAIADLPELGLAHAMLAQCLTVRIFGKGQKIDREQQDEIRSHVRRAVQLGGENPTIIAWLVTSYSLLGDHEAGHRLATRVAESHPNSPSSHYAVGSACLALGRTAEAVAALTEYERLARSDSMRPIALTCLCMACWYEGRSEEAEAAIDRALTLHPEFELALKWKAMLTGLRGDERAAQVAIRRLRAAEPTMTIEAHVRQIDRHPTLGSRSGELVATLRRLWEATEGKA